MENSNSYKAKVTFSPDGTVLAMITGDHVTLYDVAKRSRFKILQGHRESVLDVAYSPDGRWIATGSLDYTTRIWDVRSGDCIATLPALGSPAFAVKWSPNGEYLAVMENNLRQVFVYKMSGNPTLRQWLTGSLHGLFSVAAHPTLEEITTSDEYDLHRWNPADPAVDSTLLERDPAAAILRVAYSSDGSLIATSSWESNTPVMARQVVIRESNTGKIRNTIDTGKEVGYAIAFDTRGSLLAWYTSFGNITLYDTSTNRSLRTMQTGSFATSLTFLDNPRCILANARDSLMLFDIDTGKLLRTVKLESGLIRTFTVNRDQSRLVVGFDNGDIASYALPDLTPGPRLTKPHNTLVRCLAFSPDGRLLASAGDDCQVKLFEANTLEMLLQFPNWPGNPLGMTFDVTGHHLAVVGHLREVDLWDIVALRDGLQKLGLGWDRPEAKNASHAN